MAFKTAHSPLIFLGPSGFKDLGVRTFKGGRNIILDPGFDSKCRFKVALWWLIINKQLQTKSVQCILFQFIYLDYLHHTLRSRVEFISNYCLFKLEPLSNIPQQKQTNTDVQYVWRRLRWSVRMFGRAIERSFVIAWKNFCSVASTLMFLSCNLIGC